MILTKKAQATKIQNYSANKTSFADKLSKNEMQIILGRKDYIKSKGLQKSIYLIVKNEPILKD